MLFPGKNAFPLGARKHLWQILFDNSLRLLLNSFTFRNVDDVTKVFFADAVIVVKLSSVANILQSLRMDVQVEVARDNSDLVEDAKALNRQCFEDLIDTDHD